MLEDMLDLKIVPISSLYLPSEEFNPTEIYKLSERINREKVQRNPVIISKLADDKYFVIDGVRRVLALSDLGCNHVLAQIVDYFSENVRLLRWAYALFDTTIEELQDMLASVKKVSVSNEETNAIATIYHPNGKMYINGNKEELLSIAPDIVRAFSVKRVTRLAKYHDINDIYHAYGGKNILIEFADIDKKTIADTLIKGKKVSLGHIRHSIRGRILMANVDLALLKSKISADEKNKILEESIRTKMREGGIRYYSEPVFIFNE